MTLTYDTITSASRRELHVMLREVKARQRELPGEMMALPKTSRQRYELAQEDARLLAAQSDIEARLHATPQMRPVGGKGFNNELTRLRANRRAT